MLGLKSFQYHFPARFIAALRRSTFPQDGFVSQRIKDITVFGDIQWIKCPILRGINLVNLSQNMEMLKGEVLWRLVLKRRES